MTTPTASLEKSNRFAFALGRWKHNPQIILVKDALAIEEALTIASELHTERADNGWMPIESAPKDGTLILVWGSGDIPYMSAWVIDEWHQLVTSGRNGRYKFAEPKFWYPVPKSPPSERGMECLTMMR